MSRARRSRCAIVGVDLGVWVSALVRRPRFRGDRRDPASQNRRSAFTNCEPGKRVIPPAACRSSFVATGDQRPLTCRISVVNPSILAALSTPTIPPSGQKSHLVSAHESANVVLIRNDRSRRCCHSARRRLSFHPTAKTFLLQGTARRSIVDRQRGLPGESQHRGRAVGSEICASPLRRDPSRKRAARADLRSRGPFIFLLRCKA